MSLFGGKLSLKAAQPQFSHFINSNAGYFNWSHRTISLFSAKVGDRVPTNIPLYEGTPSNQVDFGKTLRGRRVLLIGVPGAFSPSCTNTHVPSYLRDYDKWVKSTGKERVDEIICVSVNDPFVMNSWGKTMGVEGKIKMLSDLRGEFVKALGVDFDATKIFGGVRSRRFSMIIGDGVIEHVEIEPNNTGTLCSLSEEMIKKQSKQ